MLDDRIKHASPSTAHQGKSTYLHLKVHQGAALDQGTEYGVLHSTKGICRSGAWFLYPPPPRKIYLGLGWAHDDLFHEGPWAWQ
jgi:hypothetical protein